MADKTIHLIFKTHLDIGFTNLAARVRRQYHAHFIPQALETGEHFHFEDPKNPKFIWTTGSWLIADYLASAAPPDVARMERAIDRGLIRWHALPFTTHSELMSANLFRAGLSFSQELDHRFGRKTIAAKMTDVPGHTRSIVPLLSEAGVRFLHLGVNEASPVPDVPEVFRWRADGGEEVVVMYQDSYGGTHFPSGQSAGLAFAHTNDNAGPQSVSQTAEIYRELGKRHPDVSIVASTLDAYGELLWARRDELPVVDHEIGDSWIYGVGSDPSKVSRFLALQRLYDGFVSEGLTPSRRAFGRGLTMVPEHTWGVDIKTFLRDEAAWERNAFDAARRSDPRFAFTAQSWDEQRGYLDAAVDQLHADDRTRAAAAWTAELPSPVDGVRLDGVTHSIAGWTVTLAEGAADVATLTSPNGQHLDGLGGLLLGFRYESYDAHDITAHLDSYLTTRPDWAILDHGKPGLAQSPTATSGSWSPKLVSAVQGDGVLALVMDVPDEATCTLGAPPQIEMRLAPRSERAIELSVLWRSKPANRMPEASFLALAPTDATGWRYRKMGQWQNPARTAPRGGGQLQAVEAVSASIGTSRLTVTPLDTPLVAPLAWPFMVFSTQRPNLEGGLRFNLHNNKWGTNFPMWWGEPFVARFVIELAP